MIGYPGPDTTVLSLHTETLLRFLSDSSVQICPNSAQFCPILHQCALIDTVTELAIAVCPVNWVEVLW